MKVLLIKTGEVKDVSFGYAVNYLIPKGLAVCAGEKEIRQLDIEKLRDRQMKEGENKKNFQLKSKFSGKEFKITSKAGKKGKLFGAITKKDIALKLRIDKKSVILNEPIKKTGRYDIELKFGSHKTNVKLIVIEA